MTEELKEHYCANCQTLIDADILVERPVEYENKDGTKECRLGVGMLGHEEVARFGLLQCLAAIVKEYPTIVFHRLGMCNDQFGYFIHCSEEQFQAMPPSQMGYHLPKVCLAFLGPTAERLSQQEAGALLRVRARRTRLDDHKREVAPAPALGVDPEKIIKLNRARLIQAQVNDLLRDPEGKYSRVKYLDESSEWEVDVDVLNRSVFRACFTDDEYRAEGGVPCRTIVAIKDWRQSRRDWPSDDHETHVAAHNALEKAKEAPGTFKAGGEWWDAQCRPLAPKKIGDDYKKLQEAEAEMLKKGILPAPRLLTEEELEECGQVEVVEFDSKPLLKKIGDDCWCNGPGRPHMFGGIECREAPG